MESPPQQQLTCNADTPEVIAGIWFANLMLLLHTVYLFYRLVMKLLAVIFGHETVHCRSKCCAMGLDVSDEEEHHSAEMIEDTQHAKNAQS